MTQREILKKIRASSVTWTMNERGYIRDAEQRCPLQVLLVRPFGWVPNADMLSNDERCLMDAADNVLTPDDGFTSPAQMRRFRAKLISACGLGPANERGA